MFKRLLILFIILASIGFFNFSFLSKGILKQLELAGIVLIFLILILQGIYSKDEGFKLTFKWEIIFIIVSVFVSMFMAYSVYNQGLPTTLIAQRFMYFYFLYFVLHQVKIPDYDFEKIILYFAIIYSIFYVIQYIAYPRIFFSIRVMEERGTVRIFLPGLSYLILAYFYVLNKSFNEFSISRLALLLFFFSVFILMGTRQLIFTMFLLTMINILLSKKVTSKILVVLIAVIAAVPIFLMFQNIFLSMVNLSKEQSVGFEENIRILAGTFFLTDFFPNPISYITGNGADSSNSSYGVMIQMYKDVFGFFQSDVGIIGDFSRFGSIFLISVVSVLTRILKGYLSEELYYIKYFYLFVILTSFTGAGLFGDANSIVTICITLYIIDVFKHNQVVNDNEDTDFAIETDKTSENSKFTQ
ncbi:MAG: hypothetical protein AB9834_11080 [Lentimicrobium sp.]